MGDNPVEGFVFPLKRLTIALEKFGGNGNVNTDWRCMTAALALWIASWGHGKIYRILLASKGSQILFHVKGELKQLTHLFFCFWVFVVVVDLVWFLLPRDGEFSPVLTWDCLHFLLTHLVRPPKWSILHLKSKVLFLLKWWVLRNDHLVSSLPIASYIQIPPVTDCELRRWLFMPAGFGECLLFFTDGSTGENESLGGAPLRPESPCTLASLLFQIKSLPIALRILQVGQNSFPMENLRPNCWFPFLIFIFVQFQKNNDRQIAKQCISWISLQLVRDRSDSSKELTLRLLHR